MQLRIMVEVKRLTKAMLMFPDDVFSRCLFCMIGPIFCSTGEIVHLAKPRTPLLLSPQSPKLACKKRKEQN